MILLKHQTAAFAIAGVTNSTGAGGYDVYLLKVDYYGNELWSNTFGGSDWELGYSLKQTPDGGFIIAGETYSFGAGEKDVYLIRTDSDGNELWSKTFGGAEDDFGSEVIVNHDGGYTIVGETSSFGPGLEDMFLIRTNPVGDTIWTRALGDTTYDTGGSVCQGTDSRFVAVGTSDSPMVFGGKKDMWILKVDTLGTTIWERYFGGTEDEIGTSIHYVGTGNIAFSGYLVVGSNHSHLWYVSNSAGGFYSGQ